MKKCSCKVATKPELVVVKDEMLVAIVRSAHSLHTLIMGCTLRITLATKDPVYLQCAS